MRDLARDRETWRDRSWRERMGRHVYGECPHKLALPDGLDAPPPRGRGNVAIEMDPKPCEGCGVTMTRQRRPGGRLEGAKDFMRRRFCGKSCRDHAMRSTT